MSETCTWAIAIEFVTNLDEDEDGDGDDDVIDDVIGVVRLNFWEIHDWPRGDERELGVGMEKVRALEISSARLEGRY